MYNLNKIYELDDDKYNILFNKHKLKNDLQYLKQVLLSNTNICIKKLLNSIKDIVSINDIIPINIKNTIIESINNGNNTLKIGNMIDQTIIVEEIFIAIEENKNTILKIYNIFNDNNKYIEDIFNLILLDNNDFKKVYQQIFNLISNNGNFKNMKDFINNSDEKKIISFFDKIYVKNKLIIFSNNSPEKSYLSILLINKIFDNILTNDDDNRFHKILNVFIYQYYNKIVLENIIIDVLDKEEIDDILKRIEIEDIIIYSKNVLNIFKKYKLQDISDLDKCINDILDVFKEMFVKYDIYDTYFYNFTEFLINIKNNLIILIKNIIDIYELNKNYLIDINKTLRNLLKLSERYSMLSLYI